MIRRAWTSRKKVLSLLVPVPQIPDPERESFPVISISPVEWESLFWLTKSGSPSSAPLSWIGTRRVLASQAGLSPWKWPNFAILSSNLATRSGSSVSRATSMSWLTRKMESCL